MMKAWFGWCDCLKGTGERAFGKGRNAWFFAEIKVVDWKNIVVDWMNRLHKFGDNTCYISHRLVTKYNMLHVFRENKSGK